MTNKELKKLRSKLPTGYVKIIMEETGVSAPTVARTMKGSKNVIVLDALIRLAAHHQETLNEQKEKIVKL